MRNKEPLRGTELALKGTHQAPRVPSKPPSASPPPLLRHGGGGGTTTAAMLAAAGHTMDVAVLRKGLAMKESLDTALKKLRLSGLLQTLEVRLQEASGNSLTHGEFLELILQDELTIRQDRLIQRRVKAAGFREMRTLDDFDWQFNPTIKRKPVFDLATCRFVKEGARCAAAGAAGRRKKSPGPGHRLAGDQGRLRGALPLHLRRGPRLPAR